MNSTLQERILKITEAEAIANVQLVQALWSDFGAIERVHLTGGNVASVIVKRIRIPAKMKHPRGWNSEISTQRKLRSYKIERYWYHTYVPELPDNIKVPKFLFQDEIEGETYIVMEDLRFAGFYRGYTSDSDCFDACLQWLARFHAFHLGKKPEGLWKVGTYWHLETRPEEYEKMKPGVLKDRANEVDERLNGCEFQTFVHGDAKPANFCFSDSGEAAAVDFQYVGGGCGIKDVVYLMSSILSESALFQEDADILDRYFSLLESALMHFGKSHIDFQALKHEWLSLYTVAWVDFLRFLEGWSPNHSRMNAYILARLKQYNTSEAH